MPTLLFNSRRSPVYGRNGIVATSQPLQPPPGLRSLQKAEMPQMPRWPPPRHSMSPSQHPPELAVTCSRSIIPRATKQSHRPKRIRARPRCADTGAAEEGRILHRTASVPCAYGHSSRRVRRLVRSDRKAWLAVDAEILAPAIRLASEGFSVAPITALLLAARRRATVEIRSQWT